MTAPPADNQRQRSAHLPRQLSPARSTGTSFWNLTIPVRLRAGTNTIRFIANPQYNWDSTTIGVIYSGQGIGQDLRSDTAPNIDQITVAPFQLAGPAGPAGPGR